MALLFDSTKCVGCKVCETACAEKNGLPYNDKIAAEEKLSEHKISTVRTVGERYMRKLCMHCGQPACASVCPVGALVKNASGPVTYDAGKCMGCRYCITACAFQVPTYQWSKRVPVVVKCDQCIDRQKEGEPTACAGACPTGATMSGCYAEILAEAKKRLAESPSDYYQKIYGVNEAGGTTVLMIAAEPVEKLGMPALGPEPLPALTWNALSKIPDVVMLGGILLSGVYWITSRREEVARAEGRTTS